MGLFGYGKGTYIKNTKRFKRRITDFLYGLTREYHALTGHLNSALFALDENTEYGRFAKPKCLDAVDKRILKYFDCMERAYAAKDQPRVRAYAELLAKATKNRHFGDHENDAPILELEEKVTVSRCRVEAALLARESYLKSHPSVHPDIDPTALRLTADANELCTEYRALSDQLGSMKKQKDLKDINDSREANTEFARSVAATMDLLSETINNKK